MVRQLLFLALAGSGMLTSSTAQNPFGDVPMEDRPAEYLLWDSDFVAGVKGELQQSLAEGNGIWDTNFVFKRILDDAEHRRHSVSIVQRSGYTQPEIHEFKWDIYVILQGSGLARIGGERTGWVEGRPPEEQRPDLEGYQEFSVTQGDILHVPARVWHQLLTDAGSDITYALINIYEN
ncbi:MAG: hypothetical protein O2948_00070 [Proteobacteria bacterium]|nr:hypothetical protein [Pseudomonadota bacterium]MDA0928669.1 hypothetical protein [Pseudomonadota bacterium]